MSEHTPIGCAIAQRLTAALTGNGIPYEKLADLVYGELRTVAQELKRGDWIELPGGVTVERDPARSTQLYFEVHVTLDPVFEHRRERAETIARAYGFRLAKLTKANGGEHTDDAFMTGRGTDYEVMRKTTCDLVGFLKREGFNVRRYKLENTLVDSKHRGGAHGGDLWELLR